MGEEPRGREPDIRRIGTAVVRALGYRARPAHAGRSLGGAAGEAIAASDEQACGRAAAQAGGH